MFGGACVCMRLCVCVCVDVGLQVLKLSSCDTLLFQLPLFSLHESEIFITFPPRFTPPIFPFLSSQRFDECLGGITSYASVCVHVCLSNGFQGE